MANTALVDLPDDVRELIEPHVLKDDASTLDAIAIMIAKKRDEAKNARTSSGIETTWKDCEEAYIGIDDANRHEFQDARWAKPMSITGPVTTGRIPRSPDYKSTVFVRLTARYVDAGTAKLDEILLAPDDRSFSFSEMPVPELTKAKEDRSQVVHEGLGMAPLTRPAQQGEPVPMPAAGGAAQGPAASAPPGAAAGPPNPVVSALVGQMTGTPGLPGGQAGAPAMPGMGAPIAPPMPGSAPGAPRVPLTVADLAMEAIEQARKSAKAAETRVYDWMVECHWAACVRKIIFDAARIGVGVIKAPIPQAKRQMAVFRKGDDVEIKIIEKIRPGAEWVDPWNAFPDPACGENIHDGDYFFERDYMSRRQIEKLKALPGYISEQIDAVLDEEPDKYETDNDIGASGAPGASKRLGRYEVWYFYGVLKREEWAAIEAAAGSEPSANDDDNEDDVHAIVTMIQDRVVRAAINPLDSGDFPYHSFPWQRRSQHWAGIGVAEQIKTPQKIVNASMRALLNNAGKSAGSQIVVDQASIRPADGSWILTPDKIWYKTGDSPGTDVRQAFQIYQIPNVTPQMLNILQTGERLGEEATSIPLITQGQSGATTPDTFGAAQLQNNNANQLLRSLGYNFDDFITEPVVRQFYEWLLLDPDVPTEEKAEFQINAHGSIALVERAIQDQAIAQMGALVTNPVYGFNPKKWAKLMARSKRLNPEDLSYTEEEQAKIDANPVVPPPVQVAQIQADTALKQLVAKQAADQQTTQSEERIAQATNVLEGGRVQNEGARYAAERERTSVDATVKLHQLAVQRELAMLEYANRHGMNLDSVKADLAKTAMTLQTQRALNAEDNAAELRRNNRPERPRRGMRPPDQLPGRAGNGRAFEQGGPQ